ncbi:PLDc N-terminal domain-containing protein [Pontibacter sp. KCTC 32443]|uniref:PLDc N-terminal domain-containing protein n=1 Tax=Pontibacter TaxID=323449 RepID=UPI00164E7376|nr:MULTISPECIES: PLDc N-terminal domain-containing protein [Pontibacter]MBC5774370.1 PLDc N-terminal domain-containing protein [Pontibacter sp. KCTC 32443]
MELISFGSSNFTYSLIITLMIIYYAGALVSLIHLIFKTDYDLKERLLWMLVLWLIPILGLIFYWVSWRKRKV